MIKQSYTLNIKILIIGLFLVTYQCTNAQSNGENETPFPAAQKKFSLKDLPFEFFGFAETRHGLKFAKDPYLSKSTVMNETRLQLSLDYWTDWGDFNLKNDFIYDWHQEKYRRVQRTAASM